MAPDSGTARPWTIRGSTVRPMARADGILDQGPAATSFASKELCFALRIRLVHPVARR